MDDDSLIDLSKHATRRMIRIIQDGVDLCDDQDEARKLSLYCLTQLFGAAVDLFKGAKFVRADNAPLNYPPELSSALYLSQTIFRAALPMTPETREALKREMRVELAQAQAELAKQAKSPSS